jgi:hypothetical protein
MTLSDRHREILGAIGQEGAAPDELGHHMRAREFADLDVAGLIVYWPASQPRPFRVVSDRSRRGTWNLTAAGADAIGSLSLVRVI